MSFSVQVPADTAHGRVEWSGASLNAVFAQRRNLINPRFLGMLRDVLRFNRLATDIALRNAEGELMQPLQDFLRTHNFSPEFTDWYFLPMLGCIWSCPTTQMLQCMGSSLIRVFSRSCRYCLASNTMNSRWMVRPEHSISRWASRFVVAEYIVKHLTNLRFA